MKSNLNIKTRQGGHFVLLEECMKPIRNNKIEGTLKNIKVFIFTIFVVLMMASIGWGAEYYVSTNGSDDNSGTFQRPWRTIGKANAVLKPGDTVYIREGTYRETIRPSNSGTDGNYIEYSQYQNDTVLITGTYYGANLTSRNYVRLNGIGIKDTGSYGINLSNSSDGYDHIDIWNCHISGSSAYTNMLMRNISYVHIKNCEFAAKCDRTASNPCNSRCGRPQADLLRARGNSHYLLIENCNFGNVDHNALSFEDMGSGEISRVIIRNNTFNNKYHTNLELWNNTRWFLVEGNIIKNAGEKATENYCGIVTENEPRWEHGGLKIQADYSIIRKNIFYNNGRMQWAALSGDNETNYQNRMYHNTSYGEQRGLDLSECFEATYDNYFKNNIVYQSGGYCVKRNISETKRKNYYINNNLKGGEFTYKPEVSGYTTLEYLQQNYPAYWRDNWGVDPQFNDPQNRDFTLQEDSPMIDAGAWLTTAVDSGTGSKVKVQDSRYFMDGWNIVEGDIIQVQGQTIKARITNIDHKNNILVLNREITWKSGDGVSLAYNGIAPDIGAHEHNSGSSLLPPPKNLRILD